MLKSTTDDGNVCYDQSTASKACTQIRLENTILSVNTEANTQ